MAYEIFTKTYNRRDNPPTLSISGKSGRLGCNKASAELLRKHYTGHVLLMWDPEAQKIAIQPIKKKDARAFRVTFNKGGGAAIAAKSFCDFIGIDYSETKH